MSESTRKDLSGASVNIATSSSDKETMLLHVEEALLSKRVRETSVRAARTTAMRTALVEADLNHDEVVVERIAVGRVVEAIPPVRQEGNVTIFPVIEEVVVVERRLILKEEVHLHRVQATTRHTETVLLREQAVSVTRTALDQKRQPHLGALPVTSSLNSSKDNPMIYETVVAVFDTAAHAQDAVADLKQAGVPAGAISMHAEQASLSSASTATGPVREQGFWASLFGGEPDHDTSIYDRSLQSGSTVVSVQTPDEHVSLIAEIMEKHHAIDIDDRANTYGLPVTSACPELPGRNAETLQLAEENLAVGKRLVNRGGTRIRRFVIETPVEENVFFA